MSLILAIRANGKVYFCSDKRVTCGATIERDQTKLVILSSRASGQPVDIVLGVCGDMRMLTILKDPRNQTKLLQHYADAPTIYGLVDGIKAIVEANGAEVQKQVGGTGCYLLSLVVAIDSEVYEVGRDLTIDVIPITDLAASGSGAIIAAAFWAGANGGPGIYRYILPAGAEKYETREDASAVAIDDRYYRDQLQSVYDYVTRVDSGVGKSTNFYSYPMQVPA
jgi:hypothetical protein